jgi:hypothetical protein
MGGFLWLGMRSEGSTRESGYVDSVWGVEYNVDVDSRVGKQCCC